MKKYLSTLIISFLTFSCSGQTNKPAKTEPKMVLDSIISTLKTHSIYTENIDWNELEKRVYERYVDSDSISTITKPVQYLFEEIGDFHGFFVVNGKSYKALGNKKRNVSYNNTSQVYNNELNEIYIHSKEQKKINGQILKDSIAYIEIPMILNPYGDDKLNIEYTIKIRKKICELAKQDPNGYVIDLRMNLGGTVLPMLSGLGELFNNMKVGGATKDGKDFSSKWSINNGTVEIGDGNSIPNLPKLSCDCDVTKSNKKVAVLIGRYTLSSGELVASALKGQKNVLLFGEQTGGWSSINGFFQIASNVTVNPATTYYMSMDMTAHIDGVIPDIIIDESFDYQNPLNGKEIEKAIAWINE